MAEKANVLREVLERHGVKDAESYLDKRGKSARTERSEDPDVYMRGSVQLMMGRKISREEVEEGLAALKHL